MQSNNKIKKITLLVVSMFLILILAACGSNNNEQANNGGNDSAENESNNSESNINGEEIEVYPENGLPVNEEITLKVGFFEGGNGREYIDYAFDTFTEKFPNVTFDVTYSPTISDVVSTKISAGDDEDMFHMWNSKLPGGQSALLSLVENDLLESQEEMWDRQVYDAEGTVKEMTQAGTYETFDRILGDTYALPILGTSAGLFYDKNLFEEKGWEMEPQTWSEFMDLLETIKQDGIIPITYPGVYPTYMNNAFGHWKLFEVAEENGNLEEFTERFRQYEPPFYSSEEHMTIWNRIYEMGQKGYFPQGVAALDHTQSQMQVLQGQAALVSTGSYVENEMKDSTPDGFEWGYMIVPMTENPDAQIWTRLTTGTGYYIWANKPEIEKQWAKEFNLWLLNLDVQTQIGSVGGALPLRNDFLDNPELLDQLQPLLKNIVQYNENNNVRGEGATREVSLDHPAVAQAEKVFMESVTEITEGRLEPGPIMEEADSLLQQAYDAHLAEQE